MLKPPPALKVWEWGELRRRMGRNVTARPGRYRTSSTPYQRKPQESFTDPEVQTTVLYWAKRLGKTEMINNLHGSQMEQEPRNILVVYPTLDSAKKWSKQFLMPMVRSTPSLKGFIKEARTKDANNTILSKEFPGGTISAIGANSPSGFRQVQAAVVTCDEIDAMENGPEGDPVALAFGRAENYPDSIQVVSSTATHITAQPTKPGEQIDTGSRIHNWWLKSDQQKWFVPCGCGHWHVLAWANVKWPEPHQHELAWYECPKCGAKWDDYTRVQAILAGEWRPTAPFRGVRGFWLNGLNSTFPPKKGYKTKLHQFAAEFYDAYTGGEAALITWENTFLCEPHQQKAAKISADDIQARLEDYHPDPLPESVLVLTAAADVQDDRIEAEIIGWGDGSESWGLGSVRLMGNPKYAPVWEKLYAFLDTHFKHPWGFDLRPRVCCIDSRYATEQCFRFCERNQAPGRELYPVMGAGNRLREPVMTPKRATRSRAYMVDTCDFKNTIFSWLAIDKPGPRFCHFPRGHGYDDEYFAQLAAEEKRMSYKFGQAVFTYENVRPNKRNEALDIRVYNHAALFILRPDWQRLKANLMKRRKDGQPEQPKPATVPVNAAPAAPQFRRQLPRQNWINGWR